MQTESPMFSQEHSLVQIQKAKQPAYKPSQFNAHTMNPDGTLLLYNSFSGHRCALPHETARLAQRYLSQQGTSGPLDKVGEYLFRKGYILADEVDEGARFDVLYSYTQFRSDTLQLILLASEECNFRCIYCSQEFKRGSMQAAVQAGVKNLVQKRIASLKSLNVSWFGGEPLLGYGAIEEVGPYLQELARKSGVAYASSITTNAYLLTPERSRNLCDWGVLSYQITIDGAGEVHDRHRPLAEGGGTYKQIMENVIAMKNLPHPFNIRLRVNFDNTNCRLLEPLFSTFQESIAGDPRYIMAFHPVGKWGGPNDDKLDICGINAAKESQTLRQQARSFNLGTEKLSQQLEPDGINICYAARPFNYVIGSDGKVMKCTVVLDTMEDNIVGHLMEDGDIRLKEDRFLKWVKPYYHTDNMCKKCFFVPACQGASCPLPRVKRNERPCPPAKLTIAQTLKDIWIEEGKDGSRQPVSS